MLKLSRRVGEAVLMEVCGIPVSVSVTYIQGQQCGLAFEAPQSVKILREELLPQVAGERPVKDVEQEAMSMLEMIEETDLRR